MNKVTIAIITLCLFAVTSVSVVFADMESTNYTINPDILNQAGGSSSSTNYKILHNLGEEIVGQYSSTNYKVHAGFFTSETPLLSFTISSNSVAFNNLSTDSVSTGSITLTTSTNATSGYTVTAIDDTSAGSSNGLVSGSKTISDATTPNTFVSIPLAGTEHFGIVVTGTNAHASYASGTKMNSLDNTTWANIGGSAGFIAEDVLTVQYRASIDSTSPASTNFTSTSNFVCTGTF